MRKRGRKDWRNVCFKIDFTLFTAFDWCHFTLNFATSQENQLKAKHHFEGGGEEKEREGGWGRGGNHLWGTCHGTHSFPGK